MNKPELLAPAGGREAFEAAIAAGADAVYLGADRFNARRNADNFSLDDLAAVCKDAHLRDRKIYLAANTLIFPDEMADALALVDAALGAGIDAAIVQDIGLMSVLHEELPELKLHASTQMNIRDEAGIEFARSLGASRVTLARELSIAQIAELAVSDIELEVFAHGALCICQSGQCLLSSLIGGRSANRGTCAQPCRLPYKLLDEQGRSLSDMGEYLLSPRDLQSIDLLADLVAAGVASLKIEGRMKSAEYVSTVTATYRQALDRAWLEESAYHAYDAEKTQLSQAFNRGFTPGYLVGERGNEMMSYKRPNNRGITIGRVSELRNGMVRVDANLPLVEGDLLEVWTAKGRVTHEVTAADDVREGKIELFIRGAVAPGDRVFRVRSAALHQHLVDRTEQGMKVPLRFSVRMHIGDPLHVEVADEKGRTAQAQGPVVEPARTKAVSREEVVEHVGRLGATPYECGEWDIELDEGVGIGFSALHRVRTAALEAYEKDLLASFEESKEAEVRKYERKHHKQADGRMLPFATTIDFSDTDVARDIGEFKPGKQVAPRLYATNPEALQAWADRGASFIWLSPELTLPQIRELADVSPLPLGLIVSGRQELMISDHCFLMAQSACKENCASCERRRMPHELEDRKGYRFPVRTDMTGRGHIYNAVNFDVVHAIPELLNAGVKGFAADITLLESGQTQQALSRIQRALAGRPVKKDAEATTGHLFRRVQ